MICAVYKYITLHTFFTCGAGNSIRRQPYSCYMVQFDDVLFVNNNTSQFCELKCSTYIAGLQGAKCTSEAPSLRKVGNPLG